MGFTSRIVLPSLLLVAGVVPAMSQRSAPGAVFARTNRAGNNEVIALRRAADGTLTETGHTRLVVMASGSILTLRGASGSALTIAIFMPAIQAAIT
jgi:hypothetical protein